jgi:general secretion pathway protein J
MIPTRAHTSGFTLIEVLVAVAIFALFSTMAYAGLLRLMDGHDRLAAEREFWRALALTFTRIENDLSQARTRAVRDARGYPLPSFHGQPVDARALGEPSLEFTRGGVPVLGQGPASELQRVGYRLRDGVLHRLAWPALDRAPTTQPGEYPLLDKVTEMTLRFYAPAGGWVDRWPPDTQSSDPPTAVELTLALPGRGSFTRVFLVGQ